MSARNWVGAKPANAKDKITVGYVNAQVAALNMPQTDIDALIAQDFAPYADLSYVNSQAALNATKIYVDGTASSGSPNYNPNGGDAGRLKLSQVNHNNGIAGLGLASPLVDRSRLGLGSTQRWPSPYYSPSSYFSLPVTAGLTEETVYSWTVNDPGYTFKLWVGGILDCSTNRDGYYPICLVRLGSMTGPIVALGYGCTEYYAGATVAAYTTPGGFTYPIPTWSDVIDVILLGGGGGGASGAGNPFLWGNGGAAALWATGSFTRGSSVLPSTVTQITGWVGSGGARGAAAVFSNPGQPGTPTGAYVYTTAIQSNGGAGGYGVEGTQPGGSAGSVTLNGIGYQSYGFGGGGTGGNGGLFISNVGTNGAGGLALITAHPAGSDWVEGPLTIMPGPLSDQGPLTGNQTLYVNLLRVVGDNTATGWVTASTFEPSMYALPIPA